MFRLLTKLGADFTLSGKLYFYSMTLLLGCCSTFGLAVGSIWSAIRDFSPEHDFVFIGGNMMFWATLISSSISIPLGGMVVTMVSEQTVTLNRLGFGISHFFISLLGQFLRPIAGVLVINALLYYPIALLIQSLPDDGPGNLLPDIPTPFPFGAGIIVWLISIALPVIISCLAFSVRVFSKHSSSVSSGKKRRNLLKLILAFLILATFTFVAFSNGNQAGIILAIGILISSLFLVGWFVPLSAHHLVRMVSHAVGVFPWIALSRSITDSHMEKMNGVCNLVFLGSAIPSLILTASAIQATAQGRGGVAAWDFWIILGAPIVFLIIGTTCVLLLIFQLARNSTSLFYSFGISPAQEFLSLWISYASIVVLSHLLLIVDLVFLALCMAQIWQLHLNVALQKVEWLPIFAVSAFLLFVVPAGFTLLGRLGSSR